MRAFSELQHYPGDQLIVHHRRPGDHSPQWLVTLCTRCHARLHRTLAKRRTFPPALLTLWREHHPAAPEQLELEFFAPPAVLSSTSSAATVSPAVPPAPLAVTIPPNASQGREAAFPPLSLFAAGSHV